METCNLTEVVVRPEDTEHDLLVKVQLASILGTFQSTLTDFAYLRKQWKTNAEEERLLGVSLTGICDNPLTSNKDEEALEKLLTTLRESAISTNFAMADLLGINPSAAITTTKPSGTVSQLVSCSSGIHPTHADYYIRRVRNDNKDPLTQFMKDAGIPNEPCAMRPESTTIFSFPIKAAENALTRKDMTAEEHFKLWLSYKKHYTEHNPSVTISVREKEWPKMGALVWDNFDDILGVSFLPFNDEDHSYVQAPYEEITKEQYEQLLAQMPKEINWDDLVEHEDNVEGTQTLACQGGFCEI
jgi:ribonucleoside-diphosphate reductase alpha chain